MTTLIHKHPEHTAGYCQYCNKLVARDRQARCKVGGHPPEGVYGLIDLNPDGSLPHTLPRFNWGAALMPPLWGVAHGAWAGALLLPLWIFLDSALRAAARELPAGASLPLRVFIWLITIALVAGTVAVMYWFGRRGWGIAFRQRYADGQDDRFLPDFIARERRWTFLSAALFAVMVVLAALWWLR